jgi:integrase/recombinase XerC
MGNFFLESFLEYLQHQRKYSVHTQTAYSKDIKDFIEYIGSEFEITAPGDVKNEMVRSWVSTLIGNKVEPVSVRRKISTLRSYFKYLQKEQIIKVSPIVNVPLPKMPKKLPVVIDGSNLESMFSSFGLNITYDEALEQTLISILYGTGMRRSELTGLLERDIDLGQQQLKVLGKRNKERIIPITEELAAVIVKFIEIKAMKNIQSEFLLVNKKGKALGGSYIYKIVKKYLTLFRVNGKRSPHILRHTYATHLLQNGAELLSVKELLGHSSLASTQVYTHVNIEDLKKVYKKNHPKP